MRPRSSKSGRWTGPSRDRVRSWSACTPPASTPPTTRPGPGRCRGPSRTSRSRTRTAPGSSRRSAPGWTRAVSASGSGCGWARAAAGGGVGRGGAAPGRRWGTAAEWTAVPARQAAPLPDGASFELGASLGVPAMTAHYCLFGDGPVNGQTVLVAGGAGAVGHFAIELAKRAGARVVTTVSSPDKAALAEKAGADLVVNYRSPDAADQVRAFGPGGRGIEGALGPTLQLALPTAGPHATIVTYAAEPANP